MASYTPHTITAQERQLQMLLQHWRLKYAHHEDYTPTHWVVSYRWFAEAIAEGLGRGQYISPNARPNFYGLPFIFDSRFLEPRLARLESL